MLSANQLGNVVSAYSCPIKRLIKRFEVGARQPLAPLNRPLVDTKDEVRLLPAALLREIDESSIPIGAVGCSSCSAPLGLAWRSAEHQAGSSLVPGHSSPGRPP